MSERISIYGIDEELLSMETETRGWDLFLENTFLDLDGVEEVLAFHDSNASFLFKKHFFEWVQEQGLYIRYDLDHRGWMVNAEVVRPFFERMAELARIFLIESDPSYYHFLIYDLPNESTFWAAGFYEVVSKNPDLHLRRFKRDPYNYFDLAAHHFEFQVLAKEDLGFNTYYFIEG